MVAVLALVVALGCAFVLRILWAERAAESEAVPAAYLGRALAIEAGRTIVLERAETIALANAAKIAVVAVDPADMGEA